jgi:modulator of FtsH protease
VAAAAALAGLLFVAISINLTRIVAISGLPERAGMTLLLLIGIVVVSTLGLVPGQTPMIFGIELLAFGTIHTAFVFMLRGRIVHSEAARVSPVPPWVREVGHVVTTIPFVAAGALEMLGVPGALYWIAPAVVSSFAIAGLSAWVLLVEIIR